MRGKNVSEFANNAGYITASQVPSNALLMRFQQNSTTGSATSGQYTNFSCSGGVQTWHASGTVCNNGSGTTQVNLLVNGSTIGFVTPDLFDNGDCQAYRSIVGVTQLGSRTYSAGIQTNKGSSDDVNDVSMTEYIGAT